MFSMFIHILRFSIFIQQSFKIHSFIPQTTMYTKVIIRQASSQRNKPILSTSLSFCIYIHFFSIISPFPFQTSSINSIYSNHQPQKNRKKRKADTEKRRGKNNNNNRKMGRVTYTYYMTCGNPFYWHDDAVISSNTLPATATSTPSASRTRCLTPFRWVSAWWLRNDVRLRSVMTRRRGLRSKRRVLVFARRVSEE